MQYRKGKKNDTYFMIIMKPYILAVLFFVFCFYQNGYSGEAQKKALEDKIFNDDVLYAKVHTAGRDDAYPILSLSKNTAIILEFDINKTNRENFYFELIPCNSKWEKIDKSTQYFFSSYNQFIIDGFKYSALPDNNYCHYFSKINKEKIGFHRSGNYLIKVYNASHSNKVLFQKRIYVVKEQVRINMQYLTKLYDAPKQSISLSLSPIPADPNFISRIKILLSQNYRKDRYVEMYNPTIKTRDSIVYRNKALYSFLGGNEWDILDISSSSENDIRSTLMYDVPHIDVNIEEIALISHDNDLSKTKSVYNGRYSLSSFEGVDIHTQGKYYYVTFKFKDVDNDISKKQVKNLYLMGEFTDFQIDDKYKFKYNSSSGTYECTLLLKQGIYSYKLAIYDNRRKVFDGDELWGSFVDTSNDYFALCYYTEGFESEEIIGYKIWSN